jgi:hypothetical protein
MKPDKLNSSGRRASTFSAPAKLLPRVNVLGTTMHRSPAAVAALSPRSESSMTRHSSGRNPLRASARRYGDGEHETKVRQESRLPMNERKVVWLGGGDYPHHVGRMQGVEYALNALEEEWLLTE